MPDPGFNDPPISSDPVDFDAGLDSQAPLPPNSDPINDSVESGVDDQTTQTGTAPLLFPQDINIIDHWVTFRAFQYSRANRLVNTPTPKPYSSYITLPVPHSLNVGYKSNYNNESLGFTDLTAMGVTSASKGMFEILKESRNNRVGIHSIADDIKLRAGAALKASSGAAGAAALDTFVPNGVELALGITRNPHQAVLFKGVDLRSHSFAYKFVPRNAAESETLRLIIKSFKASMLPNYDPTSSNHLFKYPDEFEIEFHHPQHLYTFGECVLTAFDVNYHAESVPSYHSTTKAPASISISMSFTETSVVTRDDVEKENR